MLNNRETATAIWLLVLLTLGFSVSDIRTSILDIIRALFKWKLLAILFALTLYTATFIAILFAVGFWQAAMIKDTAVWFMAALVMVGRQIASHKDVDILREVIVDNVKLVVFVEFLVDTYVFPLPAELVMVPVVTCLTTMFAVAQSDQKNAPAAKIFSLILGAAGLFVLLYAMSRALSDLRTIWTMATVRAITFPPLMSILLVPFLYSLVCVFGYEDIFLRFYIGCEKSPAVQNYARRSMVYHCRLSLRRLRELRRHPREIMQIESNDDVDQMLEILNTASPNEMASVNEIAPSGDTEGATKEQSR